MSLLHCKYPVLIQYLNIWRFLEFAKLVICMSVLDFVCPYIYIHQDLEHKRLWNGDLQFVTIFKHSVFHYNVQYQMF
jgi:hypothetical protein